MTNNTIICHNTDCRRNINTACQKSFICLDEEGKCVTEQPDEGRRPLEGKKTE